MQPKSAPHRGPMVQDYDQTGKDARDYSVRAVQRVCSILTLLQQSVEGVSLPEVASVTDLPKSSAFRYLWTLERYRYVERQPDTGLYRLGLGFLGMQSRQLELLRERAKPWLEKLRDELGETINLGILDGDAVIYLDIVECARGVRLAARAGDRDPIYSTALGKAITAYLPEARVRDVLHQVGMPPRTPNTITSIEDFLAELAKVRRVGFGVDNGENEIDGRCVAVRIPGTQLPTALSLSAPAARFPVQEVEHTADVLRAAAEQIAAGSEYPAA